MSNEINALSIIDTVEIDNIANTMAKIQQMQNVVQKTLKKGHDFGEVPGTSKPTLLKPGGEKICMLFGLNPEYEFLQTTEDYDKEFFSYNIRCTLFRNGQPVAQGVGSCNSKEKKYRFINVDEIPENYIGQSEQITDKYGRTKYKINNPDICSLVNTILKMAKKRAFIDAVLQVASLSEVFTQDVEDMGDFIQQEQDATLTIEQAKNLKLSFGKYKGTSLIELAHKDGNYCDWLYNNEKTDPVIKKALMMILDDVNKQSSQMIQEENQENIEEQK
jgi:hypothetical protein|nr:MAG TPA: Putative quorum-sensing-regulated virulence factor [Caudoviricetes sp.]